jgi:hypothetical protein
VDDFHPGDIIEFAGHPNQCPTVPMRRSLVRLSSHHGP